MNRKSYLTIILPMLLLLAVRVEAASDLRLAPNLSFTDDSSSNFPIVGKSLADATTAGDRATIMFFGTAHCWNTNREAERLVALYPKYQDRIDFVIVDVNNPAPAQQPLIDKYYRGAIPTIAVIDSRGNVIYDRAGETAATRGDTSKLQALLDSAK
ncbi:MAG TPA: hypothetical protein VMT64_14610 [Candidatus Binataceae bacterium]|nr:hypothetical protein [Candidatus Binataceae bacterium]